MTTLIQEQRDDEMIKANDKDAIIKHLLETLDKVDDMLDRAMHASDINLVRDYIWHRKADVAY